MPTAPSSVSQGLVPTLALPSPSAFRWPPHCPGQTRGARADWTQRPRGWTGPRARMRGSCQPGRWSLWRDCQGLDSTPPSHSYGNCCQGRTGLREGGRERGQTDGRERKETRVGRWAKRRQKTETISEAQLPGAGQHMQGHLSPHTMGPAPPPSSSPLPPPAAAQHHQDPQSPSLHSPALGQGLSAFPEPACQTRATQAALQPLNLSCVSSMAPPALPASPVLSTSLHRHWALTLMLILSAVGTPSAHPSPGPQCISELRGQAVLSTPGGEGGCGTLQEAPTPLPPRGCSEHGVSQHWAPREPPRAPKAPELVL